MPGVWRFFYFHTILCPSFKLNIHHLASKFEENDYTIVCWASSTMKFVNAMCLPRAMATEALDQRGASVCRRLKNNKIKLNFGGEKSHKNA